MNVYIVTSPHPAGGIEVEVYSRAGALKAERAAGKLRRIPDLRNDDEALDDFRVIHWAWEYTVIE